MKRILILACASAGALFATSASADPGILNVKQVVDLEPSVSQTTYNVNPFADINTNLPSTLQLGGYASAQISGDVHVEPQEFMFAAFDANAGGNLHVGKAAAYNIQPDLEARVGYSVISVNGYTAFVNFYNPIGGPMHSGAWETVLSEESPSPLLYGNPDNPAADNQVTGQKAWKVEDFDIPDVLAAAGLGTWTVPIPGSESVSGTATLSGHVTVYVGAAADPAHGVKANVLAYPKYGLSVKSATSNPDLSVVSNVIPDGTSLNASGQVAPTFINGSWQLCAQYSARINAPGVMYSDVTASYSPGFGASFGGDLASFPGVDFSQTASPPPACVPLYSAPPNPGGAPLLPPTGCAVSFGCGTNASTIYGCAAPAQSADETFDVWGWAGSSTPPAAPDISASSPFKLLYSGLASTNYQTLDAGGMVQEYFVCPNGATDVKQCTALISGSPASICSTGGGGGHKGGCGGTTCQ